MFNAAPLLLLLMPGSGGGTATGREWPMINVSADDPTSPDAMTKIIKGDDQILRYTITDYAGPDLTDATVKWSAMRLRLYLSGEAAEADVTIETGTVTVDETTLTIEIPLTAEDTEDFTRVSPPDPQPNYKYALHVIASSGEVMTEVLGDAVVLQGLP